MFLELWVSFDQKKRAELAVLEVFFKGNTINFIFPNLALVFNLSCILIQALCITKKCLVFACLRFFIKVLLVLGGDLPRLGLVWPFCALFDKLWGLLCIGLLTTEIQWIFSGEEGVLKSCTGEGDPAPLVFLLFAFLAHKGSMYE